MNNSFHISTDKSKLNIHLIHHYLSSESYWAKGRSMETIRTCIENSLCFGVYKGDAQVGFARVVTDYAVFAWIMDVFILSAHRKKGLSKMLIKAIRNHDALQGLQRWGLTTEDAHGLYEQFGFQRVKKPEWFMEIVSSHRNLE